jgi:hypothetical protein
MNVVTRILEIAFCTRSLRPNNLASTFFTNLTERVTHRRVPNKQVYLFRQYIFPKVPGPVRVLFPGML